MNINIKNCEVKIISGTDTLEINGGTQPAAAEAPAESTRPAEYLEMTIQRSYKGDKWER